MIFVFIQSVSGVVKMREIAFKYKLLNKDNIFKKYLTTVQGCTIRYDSLSLLKMSATLNMSEDQSIDYINDKIQPFMLLNGEVYPLGVFLISSPKRIKDIGTKREIMLYSNLQLIAEDITLSRFLINKGENVVNTVKRIINTKCEIEPSTKTTSIVREYEIGTSKLEIVNELLKSINYTTLFVDLEGNYKATPYTLPTDREIEITYNEGQKSIIVPNMTIDFDLFNVPNKIVRYTNHPDINPPLVAIYENTNIDSPTSTVNRRTISHAKEVEVSDMETLLAIAKKDCYEATDIYEHTLFETALNPIHEFSNCLFIKNGDVVGKYIETSWEMTLEVGGKMKHEARRVISV